MGFEKNKVLALIYIEGETITDSNDAVEKFLKGPLGYTHRYYN